MIGNETRRSQAERIACRTENYPAIAESHPVAGETASGYSCATTSVVIVAPALRHHRRRVQDRAQAPAGRAAGGLALRRGRPATRPAAETPINTEAGPQTRPPAILGRGRHDAEGRSDAMRVRIMNTGLDGKPLADEGEVFASKSALEVDTAMRGAAPVSDQGTLKDYIDMVLRNARRSPASTSSSRATRPRARRAPSSPRWSITAGRKSTTADRRPGPGSPASRSRC